MSNEIANLQGGQLPAHLQNGTAPNRNAGALTGTGGAGSVDRISIKQSRFRLIRGGEEIAVLPDNALDLVFLRINEGVTKTYYDTPWNPNQEAEAPTCHSDDGVYPSADSRVIQARTCAECPHNVFGSKVNPQTGAQGKLCADSKRVSVVPASDIRGDAFQLAIPAASLGDLGKYLRQLDSISPSVPYNAIVTRVAFDTNATFPKLLFTPVRYLTADEYHVAENERFAADDVRKTAGIPATPGGPQQPGVQGQPAHPQGGQPAQPAQPAPAQPEPAPAQPAQPAQPAPAQPEPAPAQPEAPQGWGGQPAPQPAPQPAQPAAQPEAPQGWGGQPAQPAPAAASTQAPAGWGEKPAQPTPQPAQPEAPQGWGGDAEAQPAPAQPAPAQPAAEPAQPAAPEPAPRGDAPATGVDASAAQGETGSGESLEDIFGGDWDDD